MLRSSKVCILNTVFIGGTVYLIYLTFWLFFSVIVVWSYFRNSFEPSYFCCLDLADMVLGLAYKWLQQIFMFYHTESLPIICLAGIYILSLVFHCNDWIIAMVFPFCMLRHISTPRKKNKKWFSELKFSCLEIKSPFSSP